MSSAGARPLGPAKARPMQPPRYLKPVGDAGFCSGCSLEQRGHGYVPAFLPPNANVLFVGEAPGFDETVMGEPFVGAAGSMHTRVLRLIGRQKEHGAYDNVFRCFPGETLIEAVDIGAATSRYYQGDMVTVTTDVGDLTGTPNHPVLTTRGWVTLGELQIGDDLFRGSTTQGDSLGTPDVNHPPATFREVFDALSDAGVRQWVVERDVDFHGDGVPDGEIQIVRPHGQLLLREMAEVNQHVAEVLFTPPYIGQRPLLRERALRAAEPYLRSWYDATSRGLVRRFDLSEASRRAALCPDEFSGLSQRTHRDSTTVENGLNPPSTYAVPAPQFKPPSPGHIGTAKVVGVKRELWKGHVYNLHTASNQYVANGFIVHNCALPGGTSEKQSWAESARNQCRYREASYQMGMKVIVPLGGVALRTTLDLWGHPDVSVEEFHGAPIWSEKHQAWVVCTYHPSHLNRGAVNLIGVSAFDIARAYEISEQGWQPDVEELIIDPPLDWFRAYADAYIAAVRQDPFAYPLAVDIETPDKKANEGTLIGTEKDASYTIDRVNLSCDPFVGVTVPGDAAYWLIVKEMLEAQGVQYLWYKGYDLPRLLKAGAAINRARCLDGMWMAKVLQSDLPGGLGFWAPFYCKTAPWKHLSKVQEATYAAIDGCRTRRICDGLAQHLQDQGQWDVFYRHLHEFHLTALQPASEVGVPIDRQRLDEFQGKLDKEALRLQDQIQEAIPDECRPLTPKGGLTRPPLATDVHTNARATTKKGDAKKQAPDPLKMALFARAEMLEKLVLQEVNVCSSCGKQEIAKTHRCEDKSLTPNVQKAICSVRRWFWKEPFNPDSPPQLLNLVKHWKLSPGRDKKTGNDSVDRETLQRLRAKVKGDPLKAGFFSGMLDYKAVQKVRSTYAIGTRRRLDGKDRLHGEVTFKPSMMRTSMVAPNLQNVVADKGGKASLAAGFRHTVVARGQWLDQYNQVPTLDEKPNHSAAVWASSKIVELDYAGIEAVVLGWCMRDQNFTRMSKLGMHAFLASHQLKRPADLTWSDEQLAGYLKEIKKDETPSVVKSYNGCKRVVHGNGFGQTALGVHLAHPHLFPTMEAAQKIFDLYYSIAPALPKYHVALRDTAHNFNFLGGTLNGEIGYHYNPDAQPSDADYQRVLGHPYGYKHWFWSVVSYERLTMSQLLWRQKRGMLTINIRGVDFGVSLGEDGKRVCAYYPQSISRGILTEAALPLFNVEDPDAHLYYIGDAYFGRTPLRAPIHDSLFCEVPTRQLDRVIERAYGAMSRPIRALPIPEHWKTDPRWGDFLTIGVDVKVGDDWGQMASIDVGKISVETAADIPSSPDVDDLDDWFELETMFGGHAA